MLNQLYVLVLQRDAQLLHALATASLKALLSTALASSDKAYWAFIAAAGSCAGRIGIDSALLAASVPRRVLRAELACGTCCAALMGGALVLQVQACAAL
jgi:hypothetical protein